MRIRTHSTQSRRGSALLSSLLFGVAVLGLIGMTSMISRRETREARQVLDDVRAQLMAESGLEVAREFMEAAARTVPHDPISGIANLFTVDPTFTPFVAQPVLVDGVQVGAYSLTLAMVDRTATSISVRIDTSGYTPLAPSDVGPGDRVTSWRAMSVTLQYTLEASEVFDYAYFINNWGWFYGNTIYCNGNARSNGQFDAAGFSPTVTGQPLYEQVTWDGTKATLSGYRDDNEDGLEDGEDGGVFSGWDIVAAHNVKGNGGESENQHDFQDPVEMPNLSDLSGYEAKAKAEGGNISIGGSVVSNAVYGDEPTERKNLYLHGTSADPIVLDGPVVVEGDVIIHGTVTGQGAIYAGGNVYVPDSVTYADPPTKPRPDGNDQADTEAWLSANWEKDFLGLFAQENVVIGDHTNSTWRSYVSGWMKSSLNSSKEDAGEDLIPNTKAGRDGISGTSDDDLLEGDGVFTTEFYTDEDDKLGLIPPGAKVGDRIPGTGEDIDGDGDYDGTTSLSDIDIADELNYGLWGGNMPVSGISKYSDIATLYANELDAVFYTNHSFCYVVFGSSGASVNGAIVSRNENIVYGTPRIDVNYDCRLLGGNSGMAGELLPQTLETPTVLRWTSLERDPHLYAAP